MANCGCKPCSKELPDAKRKCKEFSLCVGNKSLHYDGNCLYVTDRKFKIPNGTYTSITFQEGCIVDVGEAPLPVYTPQACCDGEVPTNTVQVEPLTTSDEVGNLAKIENNKLTVNPAWKNTDTITVGGNGTTDKPWKASVRLDPTHNRISESAKGLKVELEFADSDTVSIEGTGSKDNPYKFDVNTIRASLPDINAQEVVGNGFTITKTGLVKADHNLNIVTNLEFMSDAFTVINTGVSTQVVVNEPKLRSGVLDYDTIINNIIANPAMVAKLKAALGV
nr:MAG TPA: hypothetical protein [Caudoviricetes sp.]